MSFQVFELWLFFLIGLLIRLGMAGLEARHLRWAWDWAGRVEEEPANGQRRTVLSRTHMALSAVRLGRLVSLFDRLPHRHALYGRTHC